MRFRINGLWWLVFIFLSCASSQKSSYNQLQGNWELSVFPVSGKSFEEVFGQRRPEIQFDTKQNRISGSTGCNQFMAGYTLKDHHFQIDKNLVLTKMACTDYDESVFINALTSANQITLDSNQIRLLQDSSLVMMFFRK